MNGADEVYEWRMTLPKGVFKSGRIIDELERKIVLETNLEALSVLRELLADAYAAHGRHADAESLYLLLHRQCPDDPMPLISLARTALYCRNSPEEAMPIIDRAIDIANHSGNWRRFALGAKARIALELSDYGAVEDVLKQLMNLQFVRRNIDCGIERDFFDRLPRGAIDEGVARNYDRFSASKKDSTQERSSGKA